MSLVSIYRSAGGGGCASPQFDARWMIGVPNAYGKVDKPLVITDSYEAALLFKMTLKMHDANCPYVVEEV